MIPRLAGPEKEFMQRHPPRPAAAWTRHAKVGRVQPDGGHVGLTPPLPLKLAQPAVEPVQLVKMRLPRPFFEQQAGAVVLRVDVVPLGEKLHGIIEFTTPVKAYGIMSHGNSRQPGAKHRSDQLAHLSNHEFRELWLPRKQIEANVSHVTELQP